jgi:hypothetical protein
MVTILPHHLEAGLCCPVPSHPFGDFKDKPAQGSEADAPEKARETPSPSLSTFYRIFTPLASSMASNELLKSNRRGKGIRHGRHF